MPSSPAPPTLEASFHRSQRIRDPAALRPRAAWAAAGAANRAATPGMARKPAPMAPALLERLMSSRTSQPPNVAPTVPASMPRKTAARSGPADVEAADGVGIASALCFPSMPVRRGAGCQGTSSPSAWRKVSAPCAACPPWSLLKNTQASMPRQRVRRRSRATGSAVRPPPVLRSRAIEGERAGALETAGR